LIKTEGRGSKKRDWNKFSKGESNFMIEEYTRDIAGLEGNPDEVLKEVELL
jgi:hypothetical protein